MKKETRIERKARNEAAAAAVCSLLRCRSRFNVTGMQVYAAAAAAVVCTYYPENARVCAAFVETIKKESSAIKIRKAAQAFALFAFNIAESAVINDYQRARHIAERKRGNYNADVVGAGRALSAARRSFAVLCVCADADKDELIGIETRSFQHWLDSARAIAAGEA